MMKELAPHLKIVSDWILEIKQQKIIDIGTDHGYLPLYLVRKNSQLKIWATDINPQIIKKLEIKVKNVPQIQPLCYDGIPNDLAENIDLLVITGLGNKVICQILTKAIPKITNYLFQTNSNPYKIREWIKQQKFYISKELIVKEKKHFYHTLLVNSKKGEKITNKEELMFGPCLLKTGTTNFQKWWKKELHKREEFVHKITQPEKKNQIVKEINLIRKMIKKKFKKTFPKG